MSKVKTVLESRLEAIDVEEALASANRLMRAIGDFNKHYPRLSNIISAIGEENMGILNPQELLSQLVLAERGAGRDLARIIQVIGTIKNMNMEGKYDPSNSPFRKQEMGDIRTEKGERKGGLGRARPSGNGSSHTSEDK